MARVEIDQVVFDDAGVPLTGASVQVNIAGGGPATVYADESSGTTVGNPLSTSNGRIEGWLERGSYDLLVSSGPTNYTTRFEAVSASDLSGSVFPTGASLTDDSGNASKGLLFGAGGDTNLYRPAANVLGTDDAFRVGAAGATGGPLDIVPVNVSPKAVDVRFGDGTGWTLSFAPRVAAQAGLRFMRFTDQGRIEWADRLVGTTFDVNLYRSAADILRTDDEFRAGGDISSRDNTSGWAIIGARGPSAEPGIQFGAGLDTTLYRQAANLLATWGQFVVHGNTGGLTYNNVIGSRYIGASGWLRGYMGHGIYWDGTQWVNKNQGGNNGWGLAGGDGAGGTYSIFTGGATGAVDRTYTEAAFVATKTVTFGVIPSAGKWGMYFGPNNDVNLYRDSFDNLRTDDNLQIGGGLSFGPLGTVDTNLYRAAANVLKTDDSFQSAVSLTAQVGTAQQVAIGSVSGSAGVTFGSAGDVNLYRLAANVLASDDSVRFPKLGLGGVTPNYSLEVNAGNGGTAQSGIFGNMPPRDGTQYTMFSIRNGQGGEALFQVDFGGVEWRDNARPQAILYLNKGEILGVRNIQGGFNVGTAPYANNMQNIDFSAGAGQSGNGIAIGNLVFNYINGGGVEMWNGLGSLLFSVNRTTNFLNADNRILAHVALNTPNDPGIYIGGTSSGASASPYLFRQSSTAVGFYRGDAGGFASLSASSFNVSSDLRLKKDIVPIDDALEIVGQLRGVMHRWKADASDAPKVPGVIAQEVATVLPSVVIGHEASTDPKQSLAVDYPRLVPILIEAVKELTERLTILEGAQ